MKVICQVYKASRKEEMYLYVEKSKGLEDVPEALMKSFGEPIEVMVILLTADKKLARVKTADVLEGIAEQGYFLQMPPTPGQLLRRDSANG